MRAQLAEGSGKDAILLEQLKTAEERVRAEEARAAAVSFTYKRGCCCAQDIVLTSCACAPQGEFEIEALKKTAGEQERELTAARSETQKNKEVCRAVVATRT